MEFRKSSEKDINSIMDVIKQAQNYFKEQGIDQWQNNYPNEKTINNDVLRGESYVLLKEDKIIGTTVISFNGEKTYDSIYEGKWITNDKYVTVHRIAVDNNYKGVGVASEIIKKVEEFALSKDFNSIKIDTHEDNISMQRLLKKNNFEYCGIIYLEDGNKRMAFEKIIN